MRYKTSLTLAIAGALALGAGKSAAGAGRVDDTPSVSVSDLESTDSLDRIRELYEERNAIENYMDSHGGEDSVLARSVRFFLCSKYDTSTVNQVLSNYSGLVARIDSLQDINGTSLTDQQKEDIGRFLADGGGAAAFYNFRISKPNILLKIRYRYRQDGNRLLVGYELFDLPEKE
jgi:hypothetical protein